MGTNTGIGIGIGIPFKNNALGGDRPYLPPELKARLIGVWDNYGKKNTDADRNIIKNKIPNAGGDLEILNAAYEGMSGYNGYPVIFGINKTWKNVPTYNSIYSINDNKIHITKVLGANRGLIFSYVKQNDQLYNITEIPSFKIRVSGLKGDSKVRYSYIKTENAVYQTLLDLDNGIHELPKSLAPTNSISNNSWIGFTISPRIENETSFDCDITIEILPEYEGAFVTDGVNDMIVSQNPVFEMLDGSKELTVVSMIHQISLIPDSYGFTNYIREGSIWSRTNVKTSGKTGIYGYKISKGNREVGTNNLINNILGDKADYEAMGYNITNYSDINYSVAGYIKDGSPTEVSSVAWYWTFIAKRALTTDEINQVIAYYNLDKYVKPDIYYNVKKQGLTNDTPDEDWYLKDFSGNGRDMTLYNYARTPESGINEEGGLQSDGVDDYGQFVGDLGLKDYTVIFDRAYPIVSTPQFTATSDATGENANTPFLIEHRSVNANEFTYSYLANNAISINKEREICYQSTYQYKDTVINKGSSTSLGTGLTIARYGINNGYSALALYSFMLFHYSMSKFLIERQLKKRKLGTLYPGMVEFRPIISGRTDLIKKIKWYSDSWSKRIYVGDYIPRGVDVTANILLNDNTSELVKATYGNNYTEVRKQANWSETNNEWDLIIHNIGKSPQKIGITIDKYIRFEDIVQPYPAKFRFTDVDSGQVYDWGSKIKVGSTIKILSNVDIGNYLSDIYTINGYKYNGNIYSYNELKELTFLITNQPLEFASRKAYKLGGSEPKVILYPERLKLSNDTYKRLGYIPDLTGNGNHGVFNNLAFTEESGVNEDGSVHLDGVDDYISIPTLSKGGKQVLMKVNWSTLNGFIYDQRPASGDKTFGIFTQGDVIAYSQHNNGNTYIDGIINNNIIGSNLSKITHNIVATCDVDNSITPSIGKRSYSNSYFAQMALYAFMLFDEISTDDKIKELNTYIGITPKVTLPNYYWDNYGKKNTDANRGYIDEQVSLQKTGTSVNPLENFNIGYEGMSGYNGYPVVLGANKTWETSNAVDYIYDINSTIVHITNVKHAANGLLYSYVKRDGALANIKEIPAFRVTIKGLEGNSKLIYKYLATENATKESIVYLGNGIHKLPKSFVPTDALLDLTTNSLIGFAITPMIEGELVFDCDITIEILPEYENGLAYDGVSDFTDNKNIPIFTDFTAIIKRIDLDAKNDNSTIMFKGNKIYESSIGNGFILDYCYNSKNYVYSYGKLNKIERDDSKIIYLTPESYNGNPIIKGENEDNLGLVLGKYWKGIIYKTILYSKTISLLEINFLKNLMEKDEIIDINHPIFISNTEDESNASQDT